MKPTNEQITAAARALSNDNADVCNVNREDNWNFYGDSFRETAKVALEAAMGVATAVDAGARDEREAFEVFARKELTFDTDTDPCKQGQSGYLDSNVDFAWIGWEARAALSASTEVAAGEPVAWMYRCIKPGTTGIRFIEKRAEAPGGGWVHYEEIPLYTAPPPAKLSTETVDKPVHKLSDEQILAIGWKYHYDEPDASGYDFGTRSLLEFARALLAASDSAEGGAA